MFNRNKIKRLNHQYNILSDKVHEIEDRFIKKIELLQTEIWRLKNPAKFSVGERFGKSVIIDIELEKMYGYGNRIIDRYWVYSVFDGERRLDLKESQLVEFVTRNFKENIKSKSTNKK